MTLRTRLQAMCVVAVAATALTACADWSELAFRQDHRVRVVTPESHAQVELPTKFSWATEDFQVVEPGSAPPDPSAGYFAVFVDTAPMEPGQTMRDRMADDQLCSDNPKCPDKGYLADRGIYTTTKTEFVLRVVKPLSSDEPVQLHDFTIVLLDSEGRRIGESAWNIQFKLENRTF